MADSGWVWEEDGSIEIKTQPVSLTYCSTLNCIILSSTDQSIDIIDVNSGEIVRRNLLLGKDEENNSDGLYCIFNSTVGNLTVTNGTRIGLRKDLNGIYMLKTILQVPLQETRDEEIVVEMTLPDMEHVVSGLQAGMKNACEPQLTMMQKVTGKLNESIQKVKSKIYEGDDKLQKWATCYVDVEGDLIHSALTHVISILQGSSSKGPQLSSSSALLSQVNGLLPLLGGEQLETVSNKKKMWSEANRRKTFCNWPHKDYKWAVPDTMAQAGFYHQSDRRTYPNSIDRAVCFTCNVGLVCWEPTDEPWSEHERHSPNCPFVRGECTENVPLSVTVATSPAQFHNKEKQKIVCLSSPSSVPLMATSTADGHVVVWDIRDELQVRFRTKLKITDKVLANEMEEIEEPLEPEATGEINEQCFNEILEEDSEIGVIGLFEESSVGKGEVSLANGNGQDDKRESQTGENTNDPEHLRIEVTSLGLLKNNQELESLEETPLIPKILSEAMLIAGVNVDNTNDPNPTSEATSKKAYLLVCGVPPDKNKARPASKSGKSDDDKSKMKPVSYSTQLSFESEDEFYDPLFSGPIPQDVFEKMSSPTKDAFPKMWGDKIEGEGSMKDARVLQCLNLENSIQSNDFVVSQVLPYDDGGHVLLVLAKRKQTANTALGCSEKDGLLSNRYDGLTEGSMPTDNFEGGLTPEVVNSESSGSVTLPYNTSSSYNEEDVVSSHESSGVASQGSSNALQSNDSCPTDESLLSVEASQVNDNLIVDDSLSHAADSSDSLNQESSSCNKEDVGSETVASRGGQSGNGGTLNGSTHNARSSLSVETSGIVSSKQQTTNTESGEIQNPSSSLGVSNLDNAEKSSSSQVTLLPEEKTSSSTDHAVCDDNFCCLILYKTKKTKGRTLLEDQPCKTMLSNSPLNSFRDLFLLPEDAEEAFNPGAIEDSLPKSTYLAGIAADGSLAVMDGLTLELVTRFPSDNAGPVACFRRVVFCSGLGSFCACTEDGKLHFLHLLKNTSEEEVSSSSSGVKQTPGKEKQPKESTSTIPCGDLALSNLKTLVQMTTFENLVPRYTAVAPVFWSEIQQEQQQRRHPQHLLQNSQGDASCHTRTWRLQKKGLVGGDQLFELMLPRPCYVGHVDIKFTLNKSVASKSKVQVILSKPRSSSLRTKPAQASTTMSSQQIKGDLICGPIDLSENQQPHGVKGHVVLTSAALLRTKVRTLYVIFKTQPKSSAKSEESPGGRNGFSDLEEISITVRSLTGHFNAELIGTLLESRDFCPKLLDVVCTKINSEVSGQKQKELQWHALELLCWIAGISVHQPVSEESLASLVVKCFPMLIQSCFLSASRSIAHKCSRLVVLCVSQISHCDDGGVAKTSLLKAFLDVLPCTITSESIGGIHWFFTLLTGMLSAADMNSTGKSCMELLMKIAQQLDGKLTYFDRILRANFSLYGTPLDPTVFDVSRETLGLFGTSKLSDDLFNPKNEGKSSPEIDEIDLVDYCSRNNGRPIGSTTKMEKFLSSVYGILEVEPLDFCCSSMSDGCKVDLCHNFDQPGVNGGIGSLYYPTATTAATDGIPTTAMSAIQDHVQQLKEHEKLLSKLQKQKHQLEEQHQELEELGGMLFPSTPPQKNMFYDDPWFVGKKMASPQGVPQLKFGTSFGAKPYGLLNTKSQSLSRAVKTKPHHTHQTHTSFQLPVPKLLTIEKFQPGSRHFVVLDFGQNVRLTDIFIPSCPDLSSLVIDIWVDGEDKDLNRVTVSTDIGTKSLLLTDLLPPLACRYLKISLFARHGTLRSKLILGEFFGYPMSSDFSVAEGKTVESSLDASRENYLNLMYDDIFCQYGVACLRLESVLNSLEPGASNGTSSPTNEKLLTDEAKVRQAYTVCMNLQLRLNFLEQSIQRIHRRQTQDPQPILPNDVDDTASVIEHASYSKLKVISDWLVHVLVSLFGVDEPADIPGSSQQVHWFREITLDTCQSLFTTFCVKGTSVSRARVGAVLLRACGEQTWWGSFLAWVMEEFFRVDQTLMFSRERLFLLLTSMSQLSIPQYSVVTSALDLLEKLLSPLLGDVKQDSGQRFFDSSLLEWVTLYVSNLLDNFMDTSHDVLSNPKGDESDDAQAKMTADQQSTTRRWDFIVPRAANDSLKDSLKDLKGSRKELRKIKKQINIRQRRLQVLHQQHLINKAQFFEEYGSSSMMNSPSPFQITQWNKQFRQKAKKPLKDLLRLKRLIADSSPEPVSENPGPRRCKKLPRHLCLPVMKGLLAVLLSRQGACKVDFFVLICKVLGCLTLVSHPRVRLFDLATSAQLEQLLRMCVRAEGVPTSNWSPGDQWIKHACTSLLQDLIIELRPYTVDEVTFKAKEETGESANGSTEVTNDADSDTSFSDIQESEEPSDEAIAELTNFNEWFHDQSFVSEIAEMKLTSKKKELPLVYSTIALTPTLNAAEISTAEDCRLEISVEMKAERELRRLAFTSRQRFLTGMDVKSKIGSAVSRSTKVGSTGVGSTGVGSSGVGSTGVGCAGSRSTGVGSTEVESTGVGSSGVGSSGVESTGVECNGNGSPEQFVLIDASEQSFEGCSKVCHFFSQCIGKLLVDSFNGPFETDSVLELCLSLNDDPTNHPLFLVTQQAMEASLVGLSTVEGASARSWNIAISWLRTLLQQSPCAFSFQPTEDTHSPYATATMIVENPRFGRVIGRMLTTYNYGDSGKKALGPSAGENLSSLLKELVDLTALQQRGISTSTLQELLLDILLLITAHNDDETRLLSARRQPLDVCSGFLEFFTRSFPVGPPLRGLLKPVHIVDSILSVVLLHLSSSHEVHCSANSSKKRYNSLFENQGLPRERSREPSDAKFAILCLKVLGKLLPLGSNAELSFINSLADCLVCEGATMGKLLACLNLCRGDSFELVEIGLNILSSDLSTLNGLDNPTSVEDGVMKAFCLLHKHTKHREALIRAMLDFFSKDTALKGVNSTPGFCHLSELLLWVLLKLLDSDDIFQIFFENGGIDIICSKLSQATLRALHPVRGIVSRVVHQLGVKTQTKTESEKPLLAAAWESDKNLVNFAPFASIHCSQESSNLADPLITMSVSPRRARTAAWSYHFSADESWCTLIITLPNTIIVHEVVIQPHTVSLLNSTSYVTMELGQEGSPVSNISPPLLTAGLSNIRLQLTTPELASVVKLRFHRPRDSDTLGLTRIEVLGTSFYGPTPQVQPILQSQKASLNWSRALDYCLRRSHVVSSSVLKTLSETEEILDVLLKILWSFRSSNFKPCVEFILIKLASYSSPLSTQLLTQLLYGGGLSDQPDGCLTGSLGVSDSDNSENELLYQLGILQDDQTWSRLKIMCEWLLHVQDEIKLDTGQKRLMAGSNLIPKIRTIAAIIWFSKDDSNQCDHLQDVITEDKFRRIYHWCQSSTDIPMLKLTLEHLICALCYVNRSFYLCLLTLSGPSLGGGLLDFCALTTLARASISAQGAADLLESNVLQSIVEKVEKACRKFTRRSKKVSSSAKLGQTSSETSEQALEELRGMVEFLITCLDHFVLKDWLGSEEGNSFWHSLLTFLADCQPRVSTRHSSRDTASCHVPICPRLLTSLQTTVLRFFKKCVSGHVGNQRYLARVIHEVLAREADDTTQGMKTLSGFVRRLVLELLLDEDHVILAITCEGGMSQGMVTSSGSASQSPLWHPRFGASNSCRLFRVRVNTTMLELINLLVTSPLPRVSKVASGTNDSARKTSETLQDLMELLELGDLSKNEAMTLASSAMNVKNKRSNHGDKKPGDVSTKGDSKDHQEETVLPSENCMYCMDGPLANLPLPKETTVGEIMETLIRHGQGMGTISVQLGLRSPAERSGPISVMTSLKPVSTLLEVFSKLGGLALIADHLSPRFSVQGTFLSPVYSPVVMSSAVPGHSLMGFTMFLRLPGYADIFLESQRNARFMLRLILGVEDDGEGGYIPALPSSRDLPTLPFNILEKMFKLNPVATSTGACLRQTALDIGVVHLLLTCLGLLSHHKPRVMDSRHEATMEALKVFNASGDPRRSQSAGGTNSKQYWAKGTGFGTGSTSSGWDIEQALVKQKNEEEHITWILQVLASFICPVGVNISAETNFDEISLNVSDEDITNVLPSLPEILMNSCLIPTLASYLRNDSVLDMARHVPLYRAVLGFVRCIAVSPNLVPLLQPARQKATVDSSNGDTSSLCSLLTKMKLCVDTYRNRLKSSEKAKETKPGKKASSSSSSSTIPTTKTEDVENESLSLLIPDVQTTSMLVHKAVDHYRWLHLKTDSSNTDLDGQGVGTGEEQMSVEDRYSSVMMPLQFDTFAIVSEGTDGKLNFTLPFHYSTSVKSATSSGQRTNAGRARRLAQEIASLSTSLPLSYSSSVFVRCDEERLDLMKVLITGPADTPYANGCFEFDVYFPPDYPSSPMHISFETTGNHRIRFNPNLYNDGKVCLSILNTWHGRPEEKWNSQTSSFLQVLVSIQSLILVPEPYFNEPGYERSRGTHSGTVNSREYDANIRQATVKWAMLEPVKKPCPCFKEVIERHFYLKQDEVLQQCDEWIRELEAWSKEKRTMRSITHHLESLRRHTTQLREAISKIPQDCLQTAEEDTE